MSCGCFRNEAAGDRARTHGKSDSSIYWRYKHMLRRCYDPRCPEFRWYGGNGVTVCDRWNPAKGGSFENFYADMGDPPSTQEEGGRWEIDKDIAVPGNKVYGPEFCQWVTCVENACGVRSNRLITVGNETRCLAEWAREAGIPANTLRARISLYGWSIEKALSTPLRKYSRRQAA